MNLRSETCPLVFGQHMNGSNAMTLFDDLVSEMMA